MFSNLSASIKTFAEGKTALILAVLGALLSVLWWSASAMKISDVRLKDPQGSLTEVSLPFFVTTEPGHVFEFTIKIHKNIFTRERIRIIPDDHFQSMVLNGRNLPLQGLYKGHLNDWSGGFSYPLRNFLRPGENTLVLNISNEGGPGGVNAYSDSMDKQSLGVLTFGLFCLVFALGAPLKRWGLGWKMLCVLFVGLLVWCVYVLITPSSTRSYDVEGHVQYVEYVLKHWSIPKPYEGWQFYHPPLYYFLSAAFWKGLIFCGLKKPDILKALQLLSLVYVLGFVFFSFLTFRLTGVNFSRNKEGKPLTDGGGLVLFTSLLILWPCVVINSARIGNDTLLYFLSGTTFFLVMKWWLSDRIIYFWWAGILAALAVLTKSNGLILFLWMGIVFLVRWFSAESRGWRLFIQKTWLVWIFFIMVILFNYTEASFDTLSGKRANLICGNLEKMTNSGLAVDNKVKTYLGFDVKTFWDQPYTSPREDLKGRQYYWNYLLKTSLFGEFSHSYKDFVVALARGLSCGLIFIIVFPLIGFWAKRTQWPMLAGDLPMGSLLALFLASSILFRLSAPFSCSGDFRYIFPVMMPVLYFYCTAIDRYRAVGWGWAAWLGIVAGWGFSVLSLLFMIFFSL